MVTVPDVSVEGEFCWSSEFQARLLPVFLQQHMDTIRPVETQYGLMATRWQSSLTRGEAERGAEELVGGREAAVEESPYREILNIILKMRGS